MAAPPPPLAFQAISNVDEPAGSDPKLSQGKRKFSLFNIGSSRRLSVIAPWVKARLSLPNDTSGGVSSRASSRASGASSNSSLSTSLRRKKKRSVSSSAMILSEKGESGADEENKETPASEQDAQNAPESERNAENGTAQLKPHLSEKSYPILPDKVIVTDTMTDTEKEETFTYPDRSKPVPPLYKQNQVTDLDRSVKEFQCLSDRGRTLGAAFIFADAPVRRSLEEEWELEIARVARERRISTDSVLRRPSDPLKGKTSTATQALMTWISRWRRKTFAGSSSKSRQQRVDAKVSALEETEKMFPRDAETSFSIEQAHGLYNQNALTKRGIEIDDPQSSLIYGQFRFQVSPSTPKSSLRLIGRQKTSIEETMPLAADQESCKPEQGLLQVEHSPLIQGSSDSTSSCLSLFDHVVCVHQAESPGKHPTSELHTTPKMNQHNASNKNLKGDSGELFDSCAKSSSYSLNGFIRALGFNKSDSHITENMTQIHPDSLGFRKSQSLSSSNLRRNVETLTKTGANAMSIQHTENRVKQNFPPASRHNSSANDCRKRLDRNEPSFGYSTRSQSLPERLKRMSRPQDSSDELLIDGSNSQQDSMKRPFSFPLIDQPFSSRQPCAGRKTNKTGAYRSRLTNRPKEDKRKHIKYSPLPLKREHYVDDMIDCADDFQLTNLERNGHDKGGGGLENISDSTNFNERGRGTLDASYGENVFLHRTIHLAKGNFERSHPHRNKCFAPGLGSESIKNSPTYNAYNSPRSISQTLSKARNSNESVLNSHGVYNNNKDAAFDSLLERTSDSISTNPSGLQSNGFFRSYSDNGSMDKERGKTLSTLPLNQVSLSTHVIGVSNDLQNSDLYRRRMSPKREKNLRFASKSADKLHNVSSSAFTAVAKDPRSVEKQSDSAVPDLSTESSCPINISNITTESFDHSSGVKRKGSNTVESSRSGSSPSLYVSAQASKSYNDSASASFVSCASSVCSNNVFTYPTARDWPQTAKRHLSDYSRKEESNGDIGLLYDGTFQSPHTTMPSQVTDGLKNNKRSTELNDPGMPFRLSSNVDGESGQSFSEAKRPVSWSSEDCHIFNNTTGCHTLYSPLESPQDESAQAASLSSLETIPFCNIQLPSDFHNSNGSEDQQNQSSSVCLGHSTSQNSSDSFTSHWKDASYSGKRESRRQKESLPAKPNKNSKESGINKLFNMVNDPRKSLSSLHLAIPLVGHTSVNMDPRICSLCLIFQLHNHCFNTSSITRQTHLVYDVHSSLFQLPYLCLPTYPIFVSDSSYLFQCLHLHLILPQDCFHAEQQPLQVPSTVSDDTILPLLRSITDIHIPPITNLDNRFAVGNTWPFASISPDYISIKSGKKMQVVSAASNLEIVDKAKTMYKDKQTEKENNRSEVRAVDDISNDALPGTVGSDLDKLITTHCFNDLFSATESSCTLNTRMSTCPGDSPFQSVKYMCSPAFDFSEMSPKHFDDEVLRSFFYCTPSWFYSICRCRKEGILSWSLEEPVRLNSDLSKLVSNHFHQNVYRALPLTWQSMCFHNLQLDGRKFSDGTLTLQSDSAMCHPEMSKSRGSNHMPRAQSVNSSLTLSAPLSSASDKTCANSARGDIPVGSKYFSADNNHHGNKISVPEPKKRTWSLSKGEGCIFKFHKPWAQSRSTRSEHSNASSPGSPVVKRTSLRKRAVIAAGIRDSLIGETLISLLPTTDQANTGGSSAETSGQSCPNSDPDQRSVNCDQNGTPRTPPSSFPGGTFPPIAAKTVHSALMKCVPTLTCPEPVQSPSEKSGRYQPSNYASAAESTVNTPTSAGSGTPSSTCEIFVRSIFDAFVTGNGFISSSEPCLPIFSLPGNTAENGQDVGMPPLDVPLTPLLARNDNRRRSASTRGGENGESEPGASGTAAASVDIPGETSTSSASGAECKLYQLARKNREALLGSTHTFTLGSPTSVSPGGSSTITATGAATGGEGSDHQQTRPRKQSTLSHSWFSLDDLESTRKPSRFRLRSFYYLNSLRHQIERAFSVGHIRSFLGLGEAEVRKKRNASRKMTRDTLAANQINVIITRCESIILDRSAEEMEGQPLRDRCKSFLSYFYLSGLIQYHWPC